MTNADRKKSFGSRVLALLVAVATAIGVGAVAAPQASADSRAALRPGCSWSDYQFYVQNCWVSSPSMGQDIQVQIQAASAGGNGAVLMLDGLRAPDTHSDWTTRGQAPDLFVDENVTLVMPVGGAAQFYADWKGPYRGPNGPKNPKWETFLTTELPGYLAANFGVAPNNYAAVGLSMGALGALNLAAYHRDQFKQVTSLSGYMNPANPVLSGAIQGVMLMDYPGANVFDMWGATGAFRNSPLLNVSRFSGMPMYLSAMNGIPGIQDIMSISLSDPLGPVAGTALEASSFIETTKFAAAATVAGARVQTSYPVIGVHNWNHWNPELAKAKGHILAALGA